MIIDSRCRELLSISTKLFRDKGNRDQLNQEIAELFYPMRADFTQSLDYAQFATTVMDGSTLLARETLQNAIKSMLRQGEWFQVSTGNVDLDKSAANAKALKYATAALRSIIDDRRSQFDVATDEADGDWVAFGNPVLSVELAAAARHLVFKAHHPRDNAWMVNADGKIDTNHRKLKMSAKQMVEKMDGGAWTGELHQDVRDAYRLDPTQEFNIRHILMPTAMMYASDAGKMRQIRHPYVSIYVDVDHETYLNERGAAVFNYVIPRWKRVSGRSDGWSPVATNALADARMLQSMALTILEQGERATDPPVVSQAEIFTRGFNNVAGGLSEVDIPEGMKLNEVLTTLETSDGNLRIGVELKADIRALIAEAWLLNKLFLPRLNDMREVEVMVRSEEFRRAALPFFAPIETQYHSELLGTAFDVAAHLRMIRVEEFPEELQGADAHFGFKSPLNEAEGMKVVGAFRQSVQLLAEGGTVDSTVANMFDFRKATRDAVVGAGADPDWLLSDIKVREKDQEAERVKQLQQAAAIAQGGAGAVADVSNATIAAKNAGLMEAA